MSRRRHERTARRRREEADALAGTAARALAGTALVAFLAAGCSHGPSGGGATATGDAHGAHGDDGHKDDGHKDEAAHEELPTRVRLSPEAIEGAKIRTAKVARESISATLSLVGEIAADPDKLARVASPADGRIETISFKEGSPVKRGDVLAVVRVPELGKVRGALASASARAKAARANADRLKVLLERKLVSQQELDNAFAEAAAHEADARALSAELSAMGTGGGAGASLSLRAPIDGVVVARDAVVGQPVTPESVLATVADLGTVWFLARVFEKDLDRLRAGAAVEVELNAYPHERFTGALEYIGKQVDPVARTFTARVVLTNRDDKLRLGLFGSARVSTGEDAKRRPALVVERSALTEIAGKKAVFVRHPDDDFELHEVTLGESALGKVEILSGLREGEDVVVDGVFSLKSVLLKSAFAEEDH